MNPHVDRDDRGSEHVVRNALALGLTLVATAGTVTWAVQQTPTAPPVTLILRTSQDRHTFHPGEIIPIELEFSSAIKGRYVVDGATYDRSGRLTIDTYRVSPDRGVVDPLLDYLAFGSFMGGGIRGMGVLGDKPVVVKLQLNDWFRFDEPGTYELSVRSGRLTDDTAPAATRYVPLPVESNGLTLTILPPDPQWARAQLKALLAQLDPPTAAREPREACRALRFLGTNGAVDAMIRRYDLPGCEFEFMAGLFGAPDRGHVVSEMAARLDAPDQSVSEGYLRTLSILTVYQEHPEFRVPQTADSKGRSGAPGEIAKHQDLLEAARAGYTARMSAAAAKKDPKARALTAASALENAPPKDPAAREALRDQVVAAFLDLPGDVQSRFLEYRWPAVATPAMAPTLRTLADAGDRRSSSGSLADLALRRLYAVEPDDARPRMLAQIGNPPQGATIKTLGQLPDQELRDLDQALAANVVNPRSGGLDSLVIRTALLERYASASALPAVLPWIDGRWSRLACDPLSSTLAYVARVDPARGQEMLERTVSTRAGVSTRCYQYVLGAIARIRMTPPVEAVAIAHLTDSYPDVARDAAEALGAAGSAAAREPLLKAFEQWHAAWNGRADDLRYTQAVPNPNAPQAMVERAYWQALTFGYGWHSTRADLERVQQWCVTDGCRNEIGGLFDQASQTRIRISSLDEPFAGISLAQHDLHSLAELARRVSQYPKGTGFTLDVQALDPRAAPDVSARVMKMAADLGMTIK